jgi:hypothetical protein
MEKNGVVLFAVCVSWRLAFVPFGTEPAYQRLKIRIEVQLALSLVRDFLQHRLRREMDTERSEELSPVRVSQDAAIFGLPSLPVAATPVV